MIINFNIWKIGLLVEHWFCLGMVRKKLLPELSLGTLIHLREEVNSMFEVIFSYLLFKY